MIRGFQVSTSRIFKISLLSIAMILISLSTAAGQTAGKKSSGTRMGISGLAGAGIFFATDDDYYFNEGTDLYPEIGLQLDVSLVRMGIKAAAIYRKYEAWGWYSDPYGYYSYHDEYTIAFIPVQAEFLIAPLSAMMKSDITPYFGFMAGAFIPVGDNDEVLFAPSIKAGMEFSLEPLILYGDLRYTYAKDSNRELNAGGVMLVVGAGLRLGTSGK